MQELKMSISESLPILINVWHWYSSSFQLSNVHTVKCACQPFSSGGKLAHFCPLSAVCYFVIKIRSKCAHSSMWESQTYHMRETTGNPTTAIQSVSHIHPSSLLITCGYGSIFANISCHSFIPKHAFLFQSSSLFFFLTVYS